MYDNWTQFRTLDYHLPVSYFNEIMKKDVNLLLIDGKWNETRLKEIFLTNLTEHIISNVEVNVSGNIDSNFLIPIMYEIF